MGTDFFDDLGVTLSRTAKEFGQRAESLYETQRLRGKISGEERSISKLMAELGKTLYRAYGKGAELTDEQRELCEKIDRHKEMIDRCKGELAGKKGKKLCPSCKEAVDRAVAFCPYCGAACPNPEPEEEAGDVVTEVDEVIIEDVTEVAEESAETAAPGFCGGQECEEGEAEEGVTVETEAEDGK